jgi:hypothetical protein
MAGQMQIIIKFNFSKEFSRKCKGTTQYILTIKNQSHNLKRNSKKIRKTTMNKIMFKTKNRVKPIRK